MSLNTSVRTFGAIFRGFVKTNASALLSFAHYPTRSAFLESVREYHKVYLYPPRLKKVAASHLVNESDTISLTKCVRNEWQTTLVELAVIVGIVRSKAPPKIFEIGTFDGRTTLAMHMNQPEAKIVTIDLPGGKEDSPGGNEPGYLFHNKAREGAIEQLYGNSLEFDFSPWFGSQDLIFVDAGHSYTNALADSKTALRLIEGREGTVVWHDYAVMPGVTKAVEEVRESVLSEVEVCWIEGTSLAVLTTKAGVPLKLDKSISG